MKKIELKIYIGEVAEHLKKEENFAFVEVVTPYIPTGLNHKGIDSEIYSSDTLATYICDWYDVLRHFNCSKDDIEVEIFLNKKSVHKKFIGEEIVNVIDKISKIEKADLYKLRDFNF